MKARLYQKYVEEVVPALKQKHQYSNLHQVPRMTKIVVNMGISASLEKSAIDDASKDLALITGRKPATSKSRHSIANFKLREGQPIGCRVTLRRDIMYEFFDRLTATALPRIRDFPGLSPRPLPPEDIDPFFYIWLRLHGLNVIRRRPKRSKSTRLCALS